MLRVCRRIISTLSRSIVLWDRRGLGWLDGGGIENKITGQVYQLCGMKEVRANNCHYQEISTRKENHTINSNLLS